MKGLIQCQTRCTWLDRSWEPSDTHLWDEERDGMYPHHFKLIKPEPQPAESLEPAPEPPICPNCLYVGAVGELFCAMCGIKFPDLDPEEDDSAEVIREPDDGESPADDDPERRARADALEKAFKRSEMMSACGQLGLPTGRTDTTRDLAERLAMAGKGADDVREILG